MGRAQEGTDETQRGVAELGPVDCVWCAAAVEAGQQCVNGHKYNTKGEHCAGELGYLQDNAGECMVRVAGAAGVDEREVQVQVRMRA